MGDESTTSVETETTDTGATESASTETVLTGDQGSTDEGGAATSSDGDAAASSDDTGASDGATDTGEEGSAVAPDTYADFNLPEDVILDEVALAKATPIFKELGLTQEQAQKVVDLHTELSQAGSQKQVDTFNQLINDWREQSKNDGEFGGDKFEENVAVARSAIAKYGTPELKQLLEDHGVGNHPEVIRFMVRVGRTLKEDVPGQTGNTSTPEKDRVAVLYPNDSQ